MYQGHELSEVLSTLKEQHIQKRDFYVPGQKMRMNILEDGKAQMSFESKEHGLLEFDIAERFHKQAADNLGIPYKYYCSMKENKPALLAQNVNAWLEDKSNNYLFRSFAKEDGNLARALLSERYRRMDNMQIAVNLLPEFLKIDELKVLSCEVTEDNLYIKLVNQRVQTDIRPGDTVQAGIVISNSEVGLHAVTIQPLLYRLICTNGMIVNSLATRKYHVGRRFDDLIEMGMLSEQTMDLDDRALFSKLKDVAHFAVSEAGLARSAEALKIATELPIVGKAKDVVELTSKNFNLTESEQDEILENLIRDADMSLYGLGNAITKTSQSATNYERATELEKIGWNVTTMNSRMWHYINTTNPKALKKRTSSLMDESAA